MTHLKTCGLALVILVGSAGLAEAQTTLRYQFKEGEKFAYVLEQKMKVTTTANGKDTEGKVDMSLEMAWNVLKVEKNGDAQIKILFTGAKIVSEGPNGKLVIDSKDLKEQKDDTGKVLASVVGAIANLEMTFVMEPRGEMKDIQIPDKVKNSFKTAPGGEVMADLFSDEGLKKMANGGIVFPMDPVAKGKSWTQKADMKIPSGQIKGEIEYTYEGQEAKDGKKLDQIALKPNITIEPVPNATVPIKFKSQEGKGRVLFDNTTGRLIEVSSHQTMELTAEVAEMNIAQKIEQQTVLKLKN
jgi:hypothetical protein